MRKLVSLSMLASVACGGGHEGTPHRRIDVITFQHSQNSPITFTPVYDDDRIVRLIKRFATESEDVLILDYEDARLTSITCEPSRSNYEEPITYGWTGGRVATMTTRNGHYAYGYDDGVWTNTTFEGQPSRLYEYVDGKLVSITRNGDVGQTATFTYNGALLTQIEEDTGRVSFAYDGDLLTRVDHEGIGVVPESTAITYEDGLIKTIVEGTGYGQTTINYAYGDGVFFGVRPMPPIVGRQFFGMDGKLLPAIDPLSFDLARQLSDEY